ncbi:type I-E CRISPR-associated protein Cse2/CasB [Streptomyces lonarensis]|uniref:Type I-E CRISPR-associated protein Cse2/CasB n=1 Tax=Streptomyces lonarensis TaxID=700599 RepID=A0A7X6D0Y7_9ACTN|nr:type I-E CRISPR-associated protein Cse2/CasB [Streptomyces lonarensis]NJQ05993.1 type I-E CRISPR-associated protein Cse2/CasB [Streptomyces lonarensis]
MTTTPEASTAKSGSLPAPPQQQRRPGERVCEAVRSRITPLQSQYLADVPSAVAALAQLRRGVGRPAYDSPVEWGIVGLESLARMRQHDGEEGHFVGGPRHVAREDEAMHLAVTLYALHQQSERKKRMYVQGIPFGAAVRTLATLPPGVKAGSAEPVPEPRDEQPKSEPTEANTAETSETAPRREQEISETVRKRFLRVGTATALEPLTVRLREIVLLLRARDIPFDHGLLADQLTSWLDPSQRDLVRRQWGREFTHHTGRRGSRPDTVPAPRDAGGATAAPA